MSAVTVKLTGICSGGNHLTFDVSGYATLTRVIEFDEMIAPIEGQDIDTFLRVLVKMVRKGRTNAQARTLLQAGVTVAV